MADAKPQIDAWRGSFGDDYIERNKPTTRSVQAVVRAFGHILPHCARPPRTIVEIGANVGVNLRALKLVTEAELTAVEPNAKARAILVADGVVPAERALDGIGEAVPLPDGAADLVFTFGVLIHVAPDRLEATYREIYRLTSRYILSCEYFSAAPVCIPYRGRDDLCFKRDFGGLWLDLYPDLEPVAQGFFWKRTTGLDDINWWLFRKP